MTLDLRTVSPIAGESAKTLRDALRRSHGSLTQNWLSDKFNFGKRKAREIVEALQQAGYVERDQRVQIDPDPTPRFTVTEKGRAFMRASAAGRLNRNFASSALDDFMTRVHLVNGNAQYLYSVKKVVVFGSFLENTDNLGDVDVAVDLQPRIPLKGEWVETFRRHARASGRQFSTFEDEIDWPRREVLLVVKGRKRSISIQSWFSFVVMEKSPAFKYKVLLGSAKEIQRELDSGACDNTERRGKEVPAMNVPTRG
jgi:predicted nucleotidyltransferase